MNETVRRRRVVKDESDLATAIGGRIKQARLRAGLTQQQLAGQRYTKAYISALEHGIAKPSMAALDYLAERLRTTPSGLLQDPERAWRRVEADVDLAAGRWREALDAYTTLLEGAFDPEGRGELLAGMAEAYSRLDRPTEAIAPAAEAVRLLAAAGRTADAAWAEYWLASAHHLRDNPDEARSILKSLVDRFRAGLDLGTDFKVRVLIGLALIESYQGAASTALAYLEEARALAADLDVRRRGFFLYSLASGYRQAGDVEAAIRTGIQSLALFRHADAHLQAALAANNLALTYLAVGNREKAAEMADIARTSEATQGDERLAAHVIDTQARIALAAGDGERGLALADEAAAAAERSDNPKALVDALVTRARALGALGRSADGLIAFERAASLAREISPPSRVREVLSAWAEALAASGRHDEAYRLAREALTVR